MRPPTDVLRDEHRVILEALHLLEQATDRLGAGTGPPETWWAQMLDWLRVFADRNHHAKEEQALFPAMVKAGVPDEGGPVGTMLAEHDDGRALVRAMAGPDPAARAAAARRYVALLRQHIDKENDVLFPMADAVLEPSALDGVARAFEGMEAEQGRDASLEYARAVLDGLGSSLAVLAPR
jgi:hemerythrin-like domain-containing protein